MGLVKERGMVESVTKLLLEAIQYYKAREWWCVVQQVGKKGGLE